MGRVVIVAYRPKPGREEELRALLAEHLALVRARGLVSESFGSVLLRSEDGALVEIFEWASQEAIDEAHHDEAVLDLWNRFDEVCHYEPLAKLPACQAPFAHFDRA